MEATPTATATRDGDTTTIMIPTGTPDATAIVTQFAMTGQRIGAGVSVVGIADGTVVTVTGGDRMVTLPLHGSTVGIGPAPAPARPEWHPSYGTTPPLPRDQRGCGCDGR
jgi:hypothetical protein